MTKETGTSGKPKEVERWAFALQSLTPGGSEFVDDPEMCVKVVRDNRDSQHKHIAELTRKLKEAQSLLSEKWISIEERMPDPAKDGFEDYEAWECIANNYVKDALDENVVLTAVFYKGDFYLASEWNGFPRKSGLITSVSHWMPLPSPPTK